LIIVVALIIWIWPSQNNDSAEDSTNSAEKQVDYYLDLTDPVSMRCGNDPTQENCSIIIKQEDREYLSFIGPIYSPDEGPVEVIGSREYKLAIYDKPSEQSLKDWINLNADDIEARLQTTVEYPIVSSEENTIEMDSCDPNEGPCGLPVCTNLFIGQETLEIYSCSRFGTQYFLLNKAGNRVMVTQNFGNDPPVGPGFLTNYIFFK